MSLKILFVVKKHQSYGDYHTGKAGLWNSATFIKNALNHYLDIESETVAVVDGNAIDKEVHRYKPSHVVLEAIWTTPAKILELAKLYPKIIWIVRAHSKTPFLATEGIAIDWLKQISELASNVFIAFNAKTTYREFRSIGINCLYLPNIYYPTHKDPNEQDVIDIETKFLDLYKLHKKKHVVNIGCFGAIRPMKNHLEQAIAAMDYANDLEKTLFFHINSYRLEQRGEEILKNLSALFKNSKHVLVEWKWFEHPEFLFLVRKMDLGMQCSLTESFNIVSADFVAAKTPIVVSKDIDWLPAIFRADPLDERDIVSKMKLIKLLGKFGTYINTSYLENYNLTALSTWKEYFIGNGSNLFS